MSLRSRIDRLDRGRCPYCAAADLRFEFHDETPPEHVDASPSTCTSCGKPRRLVVVSFEYGPEEAAP